ncbi:phosphoribosylamine--glycine ligase [Bacteroidetes/Chlorobi group bacterium Naka2016]|jgi:phosphoribosylamine--glycine ligase|nr:MAG: phosphoribosylamine--glycine ligase [Bacteroidetes/Chlorobi group bacterium Naka2016]
MRIFLVGNGGREHCLAWKLKNSANDVEIFSPSKNAGIQSIANFVSIDEKNYEEISKFCLERRIDLVVVGPEDPLANGIADFLRAKGIPVFGPSRLAARIESSKSFAKEFMRRNGIPTAQFSSFTIEQFDDAVDFINSLHPPIVVKADGLAAGKGVVVCQTREEAIKVVKQMFSGEFAEAGKKVVIEEFLEGDEASILAITDGENYVLLPTSQDHKRIFDGDLGKNTGGMGAYSPTPLINRQALEHIENEIIRPAIVGMANEGYPFVGCLYAGLMVKDNRAKVVEFNCRFGDPETQAVLPLVKGDFASLLLSAANGKLNKDYYQGNESKFSCCVILASKGYPDEYQKGFEITGIELAESLGCVVFHSGTLKVDNKLVSNGGRVLGVVALGDTLQEAIQKSYEGVDKIHFENKYFRKDIGAKGLKYV